LDYDYKQTSKPQSEIEKTATFGNGTNTFTEQNSHIKIIPIEVPKVNQALISFLDKKDFI